MNEKPGLKLLPVRENQNCFGCSPTNPCGLHMRFHTDGEAMFSWLNVPSHLGGWRNLVHGGVITTILDEIMGWTAIYLLKCMVLTKSIDVRFLKPVYAESDLKAEGRVRAVRSEREAELEAVLYDSKGQIRSRASGVFALFPPGLVKKTGMMDEVTFS